MDGTIIVRGNFTQPATAVAKTIVFRPGVNWINIVNYSTREQFYFQTGMPTGIRIDVAGAVSYTAADSFTIIDYADPANFASIKFATTAQTDVAQPIVTSAAAIGVTPKIAVGNIVRVTNDRALAGTAVFGVYGVDMIVDEIGNPGANDIKLLCATNALANQPGVAGTFGFIQRIDITSRFYPANRIITNITQAAGLITVHTSIPHGMTVGQQVRFKIPAICGAAISAKLDSNSANNYVSATVTSVVANGANLAAFPSCSFTINIVGSGETFSYPTSADVAAGSQLPEMIPFGQDTAYSVSQNANILADATVNQGFIGIRLKAGAVEPAGAATNVVFWKVGACFNSEEYA